ncbi:MAG TPA: AI-2E family transporter [Caldilineaceae bacterium]|nr:AI-2E family transporter [Caldilineaceae bacterium]
MSFREFTKRFLFVVVVLLLMVGAWQARGTLLLGFAAALIAVGISIPANGLSRLGLRRGWSIAVAAIGVSFVGFLLFLFVVPRLLTELTVLLGNVPAALRALPTLYEQLRTSNPFLENALAPLPTIDSAASSLTPARAQEILNRFFNASLAIAPTLLGGVGTVLTLLVNIAIVLFIAIFFLIDPQSYVRASLYLLPQQYHNSTLQIWKEIYHTLRAWLTALSLSIVITAALVWFILGILLGMPNPLVVAVFAGLATFIPNVGLFLPILPITIFTLSADPAQLLIYIPVYLLIQLVESNILTPSIVKAELNIPAGGLMIFQLLMTLAFGALGLLLAVPALAVIIVLVRELYVYDRLKLNDTDIDIAIDQRGEIYLAEHKGAPKAAQTAQGTRTKQVGKPMRTGKRTRQRAK